MKKIINEFIRRIKNRYYFRVKLKSDEFHPSLNMDHRKMTGKTKEEQEEYMLDLIRRRNLAHEEDLLCNE